MAPTGDIKNRFFLGRMSNKPFQNGIVQNQIKIIIGLTLHYSNTTATAVQLLQMPSQGYPVLFFSFIVQTYEGHTF